jgi:hypothetical protein
LGGICGEGLDEVADDAPPRFGAASAVTTPALDIEMSGTS